MARDIDLGDLNHIANNARANIKEMIKSHQQDELGFSLREIYEEETKAPVSKSIAIDIDGFETDKRAWSGRTSVRYTIGINVNIWYYHEDLDERTRKRDVLDVTWKLANMFMKHTTVNGFCPQLGAEVISSEYITPTINQKVMAAGLVRVKLNKLFQVTNVD